MKPMGPLGRYCVRLTAISLVLDVIFGAYVVLISTHFDALYNQDGADTALIRVLRAIDPLFYTESGGPGIVVLAVLIIMIGVFATNGVWIYRAAANAAEMLPSDDRMTPRWAVGWYFIPIAHWFMPYKGMKEIWNSSINPMGGLRAAVPGFFPVWWFCWVASEILAQVSDQFETYLVDILMYALSVIASLLFIHIIRTVSDAQDNWIPGDVFK